MAKKKGMNFLVSHLEKIFLVLALGYFGWILYSRFISSSGGGSASEIAQQAGEEADRLIRELQDTRENGEVSNLPDIRDVAKEFGKTKILEPKLIDSVPLRPVNMHDTEPPEPERLYRVPSIPALADAKIELTHSPAMAPATAEDLAAIPTGPGGMGGGFARGGMMGDAGMGGGINQRFVMKDVDFVTVEAKFPLGQLRTSFQQDFAGPRIEDPLENPDPVVAAVELQRSRLLEDGSWGEWTKVERLSVDPMAEKELRSENFDDIDRTGYDVLLENRRLPAAQLMLLQPRPYQLMNNQVWRAPTEKEDYEEEQRRARRTQAAGGAAGMPGGGMGGGGDRMMMAPGGGGMGGGDRGKAPPGGFGGAGLMGGGAGSITTRLGEPWEKVEQIEVWAHDGEVNSGEIYRYRMKVGFFNPIAGHNWFSEEQQPLKNQLVLWSDWISPEHVVRIPERVLFFPVAVSKAPNMQLRVDVYRWQTDRWYKERFAVSPGSGIGHIAELKEEEKKGRPAAGAAGVGFGGDVGMMGGGAGGGPMGMALNEPKEIDFSTGMTLIDIIPDCKHWCQTGRRLNDIDTADIIYRDVDNSIKRVGVHKLCWPQEWVSIKTQIDKDIRDRERSASSPGGGVPGGAGAAGMQPGVRH